VGTGERSDRVKAVGIFSGGLDSLLAVRLLQRQGIEVICVTFVTPFFGARAALRHKERLGARLEIRDITEPYMQLLKAPPHGYGRNMNPCIDCHAFMFRVAGGIMEAEGAHFLFSGEVLDERPFSQRRDALRIVARESGYAERIVRPLSALLLEETLPEKNGWVDRSKLLDLRGRSRKRQMELAKSLGVEDYPDPAGGCKLTEPGFARRLKDLFRCDPDPSVRDIELLKVGRHLRLDPSTKIVVGRTHKENQRIEALSGPEDVRLWVEGPPGPTVLIRNPAREETLLFAARVAVRYSDAPKGTTAMVRFADASGGGLLGPLEPCTDADIQPYLIR